MREAADHDNPSRNNEGWLRTELVAPWWEITLVLCVMLGPFAWSAIRFAFKGQNVDFFNEMINTHGLTRNIAVEGGLLAVFLFYLHWRGWRPADFKIRIDLVGTLLAVPVAVTATLANFVTSLVVLVTIAELSPHPHGLLAAMLALLPRMHPHHVDLSWLAIFFGSTINAYLEELVFMGYAFHQFAAKRDAFFALVVMVFLRMLLHAYKGPIGMLGIGAFSLVYGLSYMSARRLWPLILGHNLTDLVVFCAVKLTLGR